MASKDDKKQSKDDKKQDVPQKTVFLTNLEKKTTKDDLFDHFGKVGNVKRCFVVTEKGKNECNGLGYVTFEKEQDSVTAITKLHESCLNGNKINVRLSRKKRYSNKQDSEPFFEHDILSIEKEKKKSFTPVPVQRKKVNKVNIKAKGMKKRRESSWSDERRLNFQMKNRICVHNLPFSCSADQFKKRFSEYGEIVGFKLHKGFGFISFTSSDSARTAVDSANSTKFLGRPIAVDIAIPRDRYLSIEKKKRNLAASTGNDNEDDNEDDNGDANEPASDNGEDDGSDEEGKEGDESEYADGGRTLFIRKDPTAVDYPLTPTSILQFLGVQHARVTIMPSGSSAFVSFPNQEAALQALSAVSQSPAIGLLVQRALTPKAIASGKHFASSEQNIPLKPENLDSDDEEERRRKRRLAQKLARGGGNFFVSNTRLAIGNLPPTVDNRLLKKIFSDAVILGESIREDHSEKGATEVTKTSKKGKCIVQAKVLRERDSEKSRGIGFVEFASPLQALFAMKAARHHKVNRKTESKSKNMKPRKGSLLGRLSVEFAVENRRKIAAHLIKRKKGSNPRPSTGLKRKQEDLPRDQVESKKPRSRKKRRIHKPRKD